LKFSITNEGNADLSIDAIALKSDDSEFVIVSPNGFPIHIEPNGPPLSVFTSFSPLFEGARVDTLVIDCNDPVNPRLTLRLFGTGLLSTEVSSSSTEGTPAAFSLDQNYPNPFNPSTTIQFSLPRPGRVKLTIHNQLGHLVQTLIDEEKPAGSHSASWNGRNDKGQPVSSGVYLFKLQAGDSNQVRKLVLVR